MELKSKLTIATIFCAGMFVTGCSQQQAMGSQQTAQTAQGTVTPPPVQQHRPPAYHPPVHHGGGGRPHPHVVVPPIKMPHVKAKGNYRGPVHMNDASRATMQQYQQR